MCTLRPQEAIKVRRLSGIKREDRTYATLPHVIYPQSIRRMDEMYCQGNGR